MQTFSAVVLAAISLTTYVSALPAAVSTEMNLFDERAVPKLPTIYTLADLQSFTNLIDGEVNYDISGTNKFTQSFATNTNVKTQAQLAVNINAYSTDIVNNFKAAASPLPTAVKRLPTRLTDTQLQTLQAIIQNVNALGTALSSSVANTKKELQASTYKAISAEQKAAAAAYQPYVAPLLTYANSVKSTSATGTSSALTAVQTAAAGLTSTVTSLLNNLGLNVGVGLGSGGLNVGLGLGGLNVGLGLGSGGLNIGLGL